MGNVDQYIQFAREHKCSDIHISVGLPPIFRRNGRISGEGSPFQPFTPEAIEAMVLEILTQEQRELLVRGMEDLDFCYTTSTGQRQRFNVYRQRGVLCCALRILNDTIPTLEELNLPPALHGLAQQPNGLILVTGPTGSGKSTTLAAMIDYINRNRNQHIITLEDPIEYMHQHKGCIVHQREIGRDSPSFAHALRSSLREDPDVILVGEMRDLETISAAVTAAETGHLVLSTLHTTGAANTIDRVIDVFPESGQSQIRTQLAGVLRGVVTQQLIPLIDGSGRCAAFEVLLVNDAVANLIRSGQCFQIPSILQTGMKSGMFSLNTNLAQLVSSGRISLEDAMEKSPNRDELARAIQF